MLKVNLNCVFAIKDPQLQSPALLTLYAIPSVKLVRCLPYSKYIKMYYRALQEGCYFLLFPLECLVFMHIFPLNDSSALYPQPSNL